jgi:hypothetical protein
MCTFGATSSHHRQLFYYNLRCIGHPTCSVIVQNNGVEYTHDVKYAVQSGHL